MLMLSMGITLSLDDFKRVLKRPGVVGLGLFMCYGLMPAMALGLSKVLGLSPALTAGMVLIGSINGGQGSNLCTYIANGDVALSVMMTPREPRQDSALRSHNNRSHFHDATHL